MTIIHNYYPQYNFSKNKGYPVYEHYVAIKNYGICPSHRINMTQNVLDNPPEKPEANLSFKELGVIIKEISELLSVDRSLARDEFEYPFMRRQYSNVILQGKLPLSSCTISNLKLCR